MSHPITVPIYTSYYGFSKNFPKSSLIIPCSLQTPSFYKKEDHNFPLVHWKEIAPTPKIFVNYKYGGGNQGVGVYKKYIRDYVKDVLIPYKELYEDFIRIQKFAVKHGVSAIFVCCFETRKDFCHRRVWSEYMAQVYGITIPEYNEYFESPLEKAHIDANLILIIREEIKKIIQEEKES